MCSLHETREINQSIVFHSKCLFFFGRFKQKILFLNVTLFYMVLPIKAKFPWD